MNFIRFYNRLPTKYQEFYTAMRYKKKTTVIPMVGSLVKLTECYTKEKDNDTK